MDFDLTCFSKNHYEIIEKRIEFFIINLKCFEKVHIYERKFSNRIIMIQKCLML